MNVRTAAYLAMTLHFARKILRRVLSPRSRESRAGIIQLDQLVVAVPADVTPGLVVAVAVVRSGSSWKDALKFREAAQRHMDKCTVSIIDRDSLGTFCEGRRAMTYDSVPEHMVSTRQPLEFSAELDRLPPRTRLSYFFLT